MTNMNKTHKCVWVKHSVWNEVEKIRIRDESNTSLISFLLQFYLDNKPEREEIIYIEKEKEVKI